MRKTAYNVPLEPATKGMVTNESQYTMPSGAWSYLENLFTDLINGLLASRYNIWRNAVSTDSVLSGLTAFEGVGYLESSTSAFFLYKSGTNMVKVTPNQPVGGVTTTASIFTSGTGDFARFSNIAGITYFTYGETNLVRWTVNGTTATTQAVFPTGYGPDMISAGFNGRFWGADSTGFNGIGKLIYSNVIDATSQSTIQATAGASSNWISLNTRGKNITAIQDYGNILFVFTNDSIFRVYNPQSADNSPVSYVGAFSQETVVVHPKDVFFLGPAGVFKLNGGSAQKISSPIDNWLNLINMNVSGRKNITRQRHNTCFGWADDDAVYFSVGIKPNVAGTTFQERTIVIRYDIESETWSTQSFYDFRVQSVITAYPASILGDNLNINPVIGIAGSNIAETNLSLGQYQTPSFQMSKPESGNYEGLGDWSSLALSAVNTKDAFNKAIYCHAESRWVTFGEENNLTTITGFSLPSENAAGFKLYYQIDKEDQEASDSQNGVWHEIGTLQNKYMNIWRSKKTKPFNRIRFKFSGDTLGSQQVLIGQLRFLVVTQEGYGDNADNTEPGPGDN